MWGVGRFKIAQWMPWVLVYMSLLSRHTCRIIFLVKRRASDPGKSCLTPNAEVLWMRRQRLAGHFRLAVGLHHPSHQSRAHNVHDIHLVWHKEQPESVLGRKYRYETHAPSIRGYCGVRVGVRDVCRPTRVSSKFYILLGLCPWRRKALQSSWWRVGLYILR